MHPTFAEMFEVAAKTYPSQIAYLNRWISRFENRIANERAMLAETGGTVADKTGPQKGGACRCWASPRGGGWSYIQKVNNVSVAVLDDYGNGGHQNFTRTMPFDKLSGIVIAAKVAEKKASGALIKTQDGIGFYIAEKPTAPEGEHFTRPRAFDPTDAPEETGAEDRPAFGEAIARCDTR